MSRLPVCSGVEAVRAFHRLGYEVDHQTGSHIILRHPSQRRLTVPNHHELAERDIACPDSRGRTHQGAVFQPAALRAESAR